MQFIKQDKYCFIMLKTIIFNIMIFTIAFLNCQSDSSLSDKTLPNK